MICIRFAPGEGYDISGSPAELRGVAESIAALRGSVSLATNTAQSPAPYPFVLSSLVVHAGTGPVCAAVQSCVLHVTAGPEFLPVFASCFLFEDTAPDGYHVHHEYFPGSEYIAADSVLLVISVHSPHPVA